MSFHATQYYVLCMVQATILDLVTANRSSLGEYADHATNYASTISKVIVGLGAVVIVALLKSLVGPRRTQGQRV